MRLSPWLAGMVFLASSAAALFSQDLAEAAKKERERRAALKDKPVVLLTSDSFQGLKKKPAVSIAPETEEPPAGEDLALPPPGEEPREEEAAPVRNVPSVSVIQPTEIIGRTGGSPDAGEAGDAEARWLKAKEYADLLELKLNALWMQFYSLDDTMPRDLLQQEIADVFEKYTRAREEEARLKELLGPSKDDRG
ncbi:MAG: hypothetical protein FJY83_08500 [Candidatus Aminicenantes bacterium]|nr:hypothetical protein [Candidatus Aminicenantes bacterium]